MLASFHAYDDCRCLLWLKLPVFNVLKGGGLLGIFCLLFPSGDPPVLGAGISVASALRSSLYVAVPHLRVHGVPMSLDELYWSSLDIHPPKMQFFICCFGSSIWRKSQTVGNSIQPSWISHPTIYSCRSEVVTLF